MRFFLSGAYFYYESRASSFIGMALLLDNDLVHLPKLSIKFQQPEIVVFDKFLDIPFGTHDDQLMICFDCLTVGANCSEFV